MRLIPRRAAAQKIAGAAFLGIIAVIAFIAIYVAAIDGQASASVGPIETVGIDADTAGNTARTGVGSDTTRESCAALSQGETRTIDVFASPVPNERGISGYDFDLLFNPALVRVISVDYEQLLNAVPGSDVEVFGDTSNSAGSLLTAAVDFGPLGVEPAGTSEIGPGILARITLEGRSQTGVSQLAVQGLRISDDDGAFIPIETTLNARIAVNTDCSAADSTVTPPSPGIDRLDTDCNESVDANDALQILLHLGGLPPASSSCPIIGTSVGARIAGDVDCNNVVNALDALYILRAYASLTDQLAGICAS